MTHAEVFTKIIAEFMNIPYENAEHAFTYFRAQRSEPEPEGLDDELSDRWAKILEHIYRNSDIMATVSQAVMTMYQNRALH